MLTQERLKELLHYCPDMGVFTWIVDRTSRARKGWVAGCKISNGYIIIRIDSVNYYAHRLAFLYVDGEHPKDHTDHINGVRVDNRWANLRSVSLAENNRNQKRRKDNTSGISGVGRRAGNPRWKAHISINNRLVHLGTFSDFFEACCARKSAENKNGYHPNHGRVG